MNVAVNALKPLPAPPRAHPRARRRLLDLALSRPPWLHSVLSAMLSILLDADGSAADGPPLTRALPNDVLPEAKEAVAALSVAGNLEYVARAIAASELGPFWSTPYDHASGAQLLTRQCRASRGHGVTSRMINAIYDALNDSAAHDDELREYVWDRGWAASWVFVAWRAMAEMPSPNDIFAEEREGTVTRDVHRKMLESALHEKGIRVTAWHMAGESASAACLFPPSFVHPLHMVRKDLGASNRDLLRSACLHLEWDVE